MLNVRLPKDLENKLSDYCKQNNLQKSSIVKEALVMYFKKEEATKSSYELGKDLFGTGNSNDKTRSQNYKSILKDKLNEKHSH